MPVLENILLLTLNSNIFGFGLDIDFPTRVIKKWLALYQPNNVTGILKIYSVLDSLWVWPFNGINFIYQRFAPNTKTSLQGD